MSLSKVTQGDGTFYCGSCSNSIIDFRDKSIDEIKEIIANKQVCGIFDNTQLSQPRFSFRYKIHYAILTLIAVFGFNVKPIHAQTTATKNEPTNERTSPKVLTKSEKKSERQKKKQTRIFKRKRMLHPRRYQFGCPDF